MIKKYQQDLKGLKKQNDETSKQLTLVKSDKDTSCKMLKNVQSDLTLLRQNQEKLQVIIEIIIL